MKKRIFKGIAATILTVMMIGVSTIGSMAATMDAQGFVDSTETTVTLKKGIVMYNTGGNEIYYPQITYNYTITPEDVTDGTPTVADEENPQHIGSVKDGIAAGVTLQNSSVTFANTEHNVAAAAGTEYQKDIVLSVDLTKFSGKAGIYRYRITETDNTAAMTAAGITRPTGYNPVRYLDVYIGNQVAPATGIEVKGYVCFIATSNADEKIDGKTPANNEILAKTAGFVESKDTNASRTGTTSVTGNADKYYTFNVSVTKNVTGNMGDKVNAFPFALNTSGVAGQPFSVTTTGADLSLANDGVVASSKKALIGTEFTVGLAHEKNVALIGLPANTNITKVQETNNTHDIYTASIAFDGTEKLAPTATAYNATANIPAAQAVSGYENVNTQTVAATGSAYTVTNDLAQVSPTGLMFRYAPYILLIGAALFLLAAMGRRKEEVE
ncbi:MAG: hypothetical protein K6G84_02160 [Lachnospiraceae bacterium]|nr:hypothetical protein [Lachnospiraceae bacterium]